MNNSLSILGRDEKKALAKSFFEVSLMHFLQFKISKIVHFFGYQMLSKGIGVYPIISNYLKKCKKL